MYSLHRGRSRQCGPWHPNSQRSGICAFGATEGLQTATELAVQLLLEQHSDSVLCLLEAKSLGFSFSRCFCDIFFSKKPTVMTNLDSILKSRDITLSTKVHLVKAMIFPLVMYGCESWTIKKAEHCRIDAFELWCWRRLLRVPWTARRSNQSILREISPEYSLEGLMLNPKLQYFGYLMPRADSFEKTLILGKIEGGRRRR